MKAEALEKCLEYLGQSELVSLAEKCCKLFEGEGVYLTTAKADNLKYSLD